MDEITALAAAETVAVLHNTEISLIVKIPYTILKILEDKAEEYEKEINLNFELGLAEQQISEEAQSILAIIYRDYWCDEKKKQEMNKVIEEKTALYNEELAEKLDPFKDSKLKQSDKFKIEKNKTEKLKTEQIKTEQNRIEQNKIEKDMVGQNKIELKKNEHLKIEKNMENDEYTENTQLVVHKKWYVRLFDRIIRFFRKK